MAWWIWVIVGLLLLGAEMAFPGGIVLLFFGAAALVVGLLVAPGLDLPAWAEFALFSVLSVVSLFTLRGPIQRRLKRSGGRATDIDSLRGETAVLEQDLAPGATGKAELRGTSWSAHNAGSEPLAAGQSCVVERVEGLTLFVRGTSS